MITLFENYALSIVNTIVTNNLLQFRFHCFNFYPSFTFYLQLSLFGRWSIQLHSSQKLTKPVYNCMS